MKKSGASQGQSASELISKRIALDPELLIEHVEYGACREGHAPCDVPAGRF